MIDAGRPTCRWARRFPYYAPDGTAILMDNNARMTLSTLGADGPPLGIAVGFPEGWSPDDMLFFARRAGPDAGALVIFDRDGELVTEIATADGPGVSWQRIVP